MDNTTSETPGIIGQIEQELGNLGDEIVAEADKATGFIAALFGTKLRSFVTYLVMFAVGGFGTYTFGDALYNLLPDHVTHHEVREAVKEASNDVAIAQLKADNDIAIAQLKADLARAKEAETAQNGDLIEVRAVVQALQARIIELQAKAASAPAPAPAKPTRRKPVAAKPEPSWWDVVTGSAK